MYFYDLGRSRSFNFWGQPYQGQYFHSTQLIDVLSRMSDYVIKLENQKPSWFKNRAHNPTQPQLTKQQQDEFFLQMLCSKEFGRRER